MASHDATPPLDARISSVVTRGRDAMSLAGTRGERIEGATS
jgi:hypothetical protein